MQIATDVSALSKHADELFLWKTRKISSRARYQTDLERRRFLILFL